jgi:hypothetical protein
MSRLLRGVLLTLALLVWLEGGGPEGQERVAVTVRQLFDLGHRLEVTAGSEVVWADPHFDRVWFPAGAESPKVERVSGGFRAMFTQPGIYRGAFTVTAGHATNDVYNMTVVVKPGSR